MASYTWTQSGGGDFNAPSNWTIDGNPATTAPGASDTVFFNAATTGTISGNGDVTRIFVNDPASDLTFTGQTQLATIDIDGKVTLATGASFTASLGVGVAPDAGSTGTFIIGPGATYQGTITPQANFQLFNIGNGAAATGTVIVQGPGALVDTGDNPASIATTATSTGSLQISDGGVVRFGTINPSALLSVTVGRGGTGTVTVDGAGSQLDLSGAMYAGRGGTGTVTLTHGASLTEAAVGTGFASNFGAGGGSPLLTGGTGTLNVLSDSTAAFGDSLGFGVNNTTGVGLVSDGTLKVGGLLRLGSGTAAPGGKGTLTINDGGLVQDTATAVTSTANVLVGATAGTTGTVTVDGWRSTLDAGANGISIGTIGSGTVTGSNHGLIEGGRLTVGDSGTGTLNLTGGADAIIGANATATGAILAVGAHAGATGSISVSGFGSALLAYGETVLGGTDTGSGITAGGTGDVSVSQGGLLGTGSMTVESGSSLGVAGSALIGGNLANGGAVATKGLLLVGGSLSGTGTLAVIGGLTDLGGLDNASVSFGGSPAVLRVHALNGSSTVSNMQSGDVVNLAGLSGVTLNGDTVTASGGGMMFLSPAPTGETYKLIDSQNGASVVLAPTTAHGASAWASESLGSPDELGFSLGSAATTFAQGLASHAGATTSDFGTFIRTELTAVHQQFGG